MNRSTSNKVIFMIDSRGVINQKDLETISRHEDYSNRFKILEPDGNFRIISASKKSESVEINSHFTIKYVKSNLRISIFYVYKAFSIIKASKAKKIALIAGDPWESALNAFILRFLIKCFLRLEAAVQIQVHADLTDINWRKQKIINQLRFRLAFLSLRIADQIRTVSSHQKTQIAKLLKLKHERIFVSPVSLNLPNITLTLFSSNRPNSLGFAGRFQADRGLEDLLSYIEKLVSVNSDLEVVLAGSGPELERFLGNLYKIMPKQKVNHLGYLNSQEMIKFWSQIGVYLSTAKSESYGRSIREAAYFGIPVLAAPSNGFSELIENKLPWIETLNLSDSSNKLAKQFGILKTTITDDTIQKHILNGWETNQNQVVNSWMELLYIKSNL